MRITLLIGEEKFFILFFSSRRAVFYAMLESFRTLGKFSDFYSSWMHYLTEDILTTKITKATKDLEIYDSKLRALRVLRGQTCFSLFGCGFAALGSFWSRILFFCPVLCCRTRITRKSPCQYSRCHHLYPCYNPPRLSVRPMEAVTKIEIRDVEHVYQSDFSSVPALTSVNLTVNDGEFVALLGPSGCGKSSLLRIVAELLRPTAGSVQIYSSTDKENGRPKTALVFQEYALFPWRTVLENVVFSLEMRGIPRAERLARARDVLGRVGLESFSAAYPHQLSGGMRQRAGIARALAAQPEVLLMDEPFGALDAQTRTVLQEELLRVWESERKTVLYVTHSIDEAVYMSDRVVLLTARPGRIKAEYSVELPRPRTMEMRGWNSYTKMSLDIWACLREEVETAMSHE
jgi:NitT/TauT family transport system ATP-binding protein